VTRLLHELGHDPEAAELLIPLLYAELRALAGKQMRSEREGHTLQPTALVHEAYMRMVGGQPVRWQDRAHFFAVAAGTMRRILVDHARRHGTAKRGGGGHRVTLHEGLVADDAGDVDVLALEEALVRLREVDERAARVVELRFFAGLEIEEAAEVLDVSGGTIKRDWRFAKAWLARELGDSPEDES
jgi:RNA polymerase sigma factor (TIGR02999 family)